MAVHYTGGGGGGLLGSILGLGAMLIPGLQPAAPFLGAAGALLNGNPAGAAASIAGGLMNNANAPQVNEDALNQSLYEAVQKAYDPEGQLSGWAAYKQTLDDDRYKGLQSLWGGNNARRRTF